ncbi:MAG: molybdopterin-dependent oxidoreductase [Thermomicrobiales bacterium]
MNWARRTALIGTGILTGIVAALAMTLTMAAGRYWLGISPPPEAAPDRLAPTFDIESFFKLFNKYGGYNGLKKFGVRTGIEVLFAAGAVVGIAFVLLVESRRSRAHGSWKFGFSRYGAIFIALSVAVVWIGTVIFLWPVLGANYRGLPPSWARVASILGLLVDYLVFGLVLLLTYRFIAERPLATADRPATAPEVVPVARPATRRAVLAAGVGVLLALPSYALIKRLYDRAVFSYDGLTYSGPGVMPITPNDKFYSVTKNVVDPNVTKTFWRLEIGGLVMHSTRLSFDDLAAMPAVTQETTLMCISNRIGSGLFSNANWTGVPMRDLLNAAQIKDGAVEVKLHGADGYTDTFAIDKAMEPTTMVVYQMNGEPLPPHHGYPARVIVPGLYGEKNVKWVTAIEVIDHDGKGFYEQQGWGPNFVVPTRSDIFAPQWRRGHSGDAFVQPFHVNQAVTVKGRAFGGNRGIKAVDVSIDNGENWAPARVDYPGTNLTWTFWSFVWTPSKAGNFIVTSRAVDGMGQPQIEEKRGTIPQGATGFHRVKAIVQ